MSEVYSKFVMLKKSISGNRERMGFEYSFGMPKEEQAYITPINKWNRRILSEIQFALSLSKYNNNAYDDIILKTINYLLSKVEQDGVITKDNCFVAEEMLAELEEVAKEWQLILAGHAHIDMNWMWGWQETVAAALSTFRTIINIMDEYPDFCFSQSQASCYKIVEDYDPELMEKIKEKIAEGRWEVTATAWVETDKNMPCVESLLRHIKYTRDYMQKHWGIDPNSLELDFSPDTFGHSANVPEINSFGNVKYYYHCRGLDGDNVLYRWKAPSGKEVLVYREQEWYNAAITPHIAMGLTDIAKRNGGLQLGLVVYGVGNHGGGPTRRDVERAIEMMEWKIFPQIKFGTITEYFKKAEKFRDKLPIVDYEMNYFSPGCYTTQSRIKMGNRNGERTLLEADTYASFLKAYFDKTYMSSHLRKAWQNILFTHFHDILTGSCVQETREHAMGLYADTMATAQTQITNALRVISENIDTSAIAVDEDISESQSEGAGVGYGLDNNTGVPSPERGKGLVRIFHIFNSLPSDRKETIELTVWDWVGDMRYIQFKDSDGNDIEYALVDQSFQHYWDHKYFRVIVDVEVASMGYTTIVMGEKERDEYKHYFHPEKRTNHPYNNFVLENEFIRAEFDFKDGTLLSLIDKSNNEEMLQETHKPQLQLINTEPSTSNAWQIGRYTSIENITKSTRLYSLPQNGIKNGFVVEKTVLNSTIKQTVTLGKNDKAVCYSFEIDWKEIGTKETIPVLSFNCPHKYKTENYLYSIPAGVQMRKAMNIDVPSIEYAAAVKENGNSIVLIADTKYGYRACDNQISVTLINTATSPDPYPERGIHHVKVYLGVCGSSPAELYSLSAKVNNPLRYVAGNRHRGTLPMTHSLMKFSSETVVLSTVTTADDGEMIIRYYETCGIASKVEITFNKDIQTAAYVDLMENVLSGAKFSGNTLNAECGANSIGAVKVSLIEKEV